MESDTIAAIATPVGSGGIGIVRISGHESLGIARHTFRLLGDCTPLASDQQTVQTKFLEHRRLHLGHIIDPDDGRVLDEVLLAVMPAPHSYTREDVVEIQAHAGPVILNAILELVLRHGARLAEPGEFTRRAFLNGRIDLTQAEAIIDVINARTEKSLQLATEQLEGRLRNQLNPIIESLTHVLVEVEASIDFPDETQDILCDAALERKLRENILAPLAELVRNYDNGHLMREGLRLVILGRPNVGKSSLMNRLLEKDRAIVTAVPGTTRDTLEEVINIRGLPVILVDTAGVHESEDPVEKIGIQRTEKLAEAADIVLLMVDAGSGVTPADTAVYNNIKHKPILLVINKTDLENTERPVTAPTGWRLQATARTAVKYGEGIDALKQTLFDLGIGQDGAVNRVVPNLRQKKLIQTALAVLETANSNIKNNTPSELIAIDLREAIGAINTILGIDTPTDILDEIFTRFCIGK